jgi:hypothetical protein
VTIFTSHFANQPDHADLAEALNPDAATTLCGEAVAHLSLSLEAKAVGKASAPAGSAEASALKVLSRQVGELGLDIAERREVIDCYEELKGFVHAARTAYDHRVAHWRGLDVDTRPPHPECPQALESAERRLVEIQPEAETARVELAQLRRQDLALRDRLNGLVFAAGNRAADAAIEDLREAIAAAKPALLAIGDAARNVMSNFPTRHDEACRIVDQARFLMW